MDRETWNLLLGRLRQQLVERGRDPEFDLEADWEEKKIRLPNARAGDDREWLTFHMDAAEDDSERPEERALSMVRAAGLARESRE